MTSLSRTTSREEDGEAGGIGAKIELPLPPQGTPGVGGVELSKSSSSSSTTSSIRKATPAFPLPTRRKSHNLLSASNVSSSTSRKGVVVGAEQSSANIERANMSSPTSGTGLALQTDKKTPTLRASKASEEGANLVSDYGRLDKVLSRAGTNDSAVAIVDDTDLKGSGILPTALLSQDRKPTSSNNFDGRISFSSLYSIGSAIYNGAANVLPSAPSSSAGSMKGGMDETTPKYGTTTTSPTIQPETASPPMASPPTTATDQTSVTTSSLSQNPGLGVSVPLQLTPNEPLNPLLPVSTNQGPQTTPAALSAPRSENDPDGRPSHRLALKDRPGRSRSRAHRRFSGSTAASSASREADKERMLTLNFRCIPLKDL
jgi:inositol-hexakisphosphate/diphosphoinositol-pentakisphosphate 1-kinase